MEAGSGLQLGEDGLAVFLLLDIRHGESDLEELGGVVMGQDDSGILDFRFGISEGEADGDCCCPELGTAENTEYTDTEGRERRRRAWGRMGKIKG